jgi:hypothetical protein
LKKLEVLEALTVSLSPATHVNVQLVVASLTEQEEDACALGIMKAVPIKPNTRVSVLVIIRSTS